MKRTLAPLVGAAVVLALMALGGAIFLSAYATCPERAVSEAAPWFKPYHFGENPWAGAWAPQGGWPPPSHVAKAPASRPPAGDRSRWIDSCEHSSDGAAAKLSS